MKCKNLKFLISMILIVGITGVINQAYAQKFSKPKAVSYLQLPTQPSYSSAFVYMLKDQDDVNSKLSSKINGAFGKLTSKVKNDNVKDGLNQFVKHVLSNQEEMYAKWKFFPGKYNRSNGSNSLKVVLAYAPDDGARPMGKPMKNNKGIYVFHYRVKVRLRVFGPDDQQLISKDFGVVSGIGQSKTWPENAKSAGGMFKVTTDKKGKSSKHPYEEACIEGALEQGQRVVYGLYGVRKFSVPMGAAGFKKNKESAKIQKLYEDVTENKKGLVLNSAEMQKMQQCVDFWKSLEGKVSSSEAWAVHYNLALGYSWLLDPEQAKQQIKKVYEMNKGIFSKVANKSGSFTGKDLRIIEHYNYAQPFAEYYAAGIKNNPDYMSTPTSNKIKLYAQAVYFIRNWNISRSVGMPVPAPFFSQNLSGQSVKKMTGNISKNGQQKMDFAFEFKKGQFVNAEFHNGAGKQKLKSKLLSPLKKGVSELGVPQQPSGRDYANFSENYGGATSNGRLVEKGNDITYYFSNFTYPRVLMPFVMKNKAVSEAKTSSAKGGRDAAQMNVSFTDNGNYSQFDYSGKSSWFETEFILSDPNAHVTISGKKMGAKFKVLAKNKHGYPVKIQATYYGDDVNLGVYVNIKKKFGEQTSHEQSRRYKAQREEGPKVVQMLEKAVKDNGGTITKTVNSKKETRYDVKLVKTYTISYKFDSKGNWTEMKMGDYAITRNIDYK